MVVVVVVVVVVVSTNICNELSTKLVDTFCYWKRNILMCEQWCLGSHE